MNEFNSIYVGMDVHKARIAIAVAQTGRGEAVYYGEIENTQAALNKPAGNRTPTNNKMMYGIFYGYGAGNSAGNRTPMIYFTSVQQRIRQQGTATHPASESPPTPQIPLVR